jgi:asparagine synthetase B (glutamine-hydrolysing)
MCGIAGLFIKDPKLEPKLGALLAKMTSTLCSRGPDSAELHELLKASGEAFKVDVADFRRYGSARKLYNFNIDNAGAY